jgi:hypothetical protein
MTESHVVSALRNKRAEVAGHVRDLEKKAAVWRARLAHIDETIKIFSPETDPEAGLLSIFSGLVLHRLSLVMREDDDWRTTSAWDRYCGGWGSSTGKTMQTEMGGRCAQFGQRKVVPRACVAGRKRHVRVFLSEAIE